MIHLERRPEESIERLIKRYNNLFQKRKIKEEVIARKRFNPKGKRNKR
jgi:hypothetical protein